jgi:hypothetical protein
MVMYLDALCYRFHALSPTRVAGSEIPKHSDAMYVFAIVLGSLKKSYIRRVDSIQPTTFLVDPILARGPHCPMKDARLSAYFDQELDSAYGGDFSGSSVSRTEVPPYTSGVMGAPLYHDLWATMTCGWAEEF